MTNSSPPQPSLMAGAVERSKSLENWNEHSRHAAVCWWGLDRLVANALLIVVERLKLLEYWHYYSLCSALSVSSGEAVSEQSRIRVHRQQR